jgi:hypothetical protein
LGEQPHTFAVPPPPQVWGDTQILGQMPPHPSAPAHLPVQLGMQAQVPFPPQIAPALQLDPLQQGWLTAPHAVQDPPEQVRPLALQVLPAQHGWPLPPHVLQLPPLQTVDVAVHMFPVQQGWFSPPQAAQVVPEQTADALQLVPQQGCVAAPQALQVPDVPQIVPVPHICPAQHG